MASMMGSIMLVAAVLEMNMEKAAVMAMDTTIRLFVPLATLLVRSVATRMCRPERSMAMASTRPPKKMKLMALKYFTETADWNGKKILILAF